MALGSARFSQYSDYDVLYQSGVRLGFAASLFDPGHRSSPIFTGKNGQLGLHQSSAYISPGNTKIINNDEKSRLFIIEN